MLKTIAVIDGNSLMHRAYHAIQTPMSTSDGTPTNAVFGFLQMFCKFIEETSPDAVICAFDAGKPEHRIAELPEYKAQRPHMDDELRVQFPVIEELLEAMNVPVVKVPGWEGDDILGTIAARDEKLGFRTLLVTGDKDACQLATENTLIVNTKKGLSDVQILDADGVTEKYGISPDQFTDYLGLMGDSSDNIPGIAGIGPKTAVTMLQKYDNIEGVYDHIDEFKGKQKEKLVAGEDMAYLSRKIATIVKDLDFELDIEGTHFPAFAPNDVIPAFERYALKSPLTRVLNILGGDTPATMMLEWLPMPKILDPDNADEFIASTIASGEPVGFAFERGSQDSIFGISVKGAFAAGDNAVIVEDAKLKSILVNIIESGCLSALDVKQAISLVYPADEAEKADLSKEALDSITCFDVSLAAYLLDSTVSSYEIADLCEKHLNAELPEAEGEVELGVRAYALSKLVEPLKVALSSDGSSDAYNDIDLPLIHVLAQIERTGVKIDSKKLSDLGVESSEHLEELAKEIYGISGEEFNIDSPKQLGRILFEVLGLPPIKKNKTGYSTDAIVMRELAKTEPIAEMVTSYRELSKLKRTYIDSLPGMRKEDGRLHTNFNQTVTATGRLSSSDPNLQNIPVRTDFGRRIRECFVPLQEGSVFMAADYSQIELRLLANFSGDEKLIDAFLSGADLHTRTAAHIFGVDESEVEPSMRRKAKAVNFGIVYGQQAFGLAQSLDIPRSEAQDIIDSYFVAYPKVEEYLDQVKSDAASNGYAVTKYGRKRHVPELRSSNRQVRAQAERVAMNHPLQGTAADIIKLAMIDIYSALCDEGYLSKMIMTVHDEIDLSVPDEEIEAVEKLVKTKMEGVLQLQVPLLAEVSYGSNWAEAH